MRFADIFKMCWDSLKRRKGRTVLTCLGVFIGCTAIIVMVSIGLGMKESTQQMMDNMGDLSIIEVYAGGDEAKLNDDAVKNFRDIEGVKAIMPKYTNYDYQFRLVSGLNDRYYMDWVSIIGLDTSALEDMGYELIEGEFPGVDHFDVLGGQYFAYNFYDSLMPEGRNYVDYWEAMNDDTIEMPEPFVNPLTNPLKLTLTTSDGSNVSYTQELKMTGLTKEDYGKGYETSNGLMMSMAGMKDLISKMTGKPVNNISYEQIYVKADDVTLVSQVETAIQSLGYSTYSMQSMRESIEEEYRMIELMLGGLGAISLLVAAIGIINTMLMSITERTKEIGIMKALGCYVKDIRLLFLMEAGSIGLIGGVCGIVFSVIVSIIINLVSMGAFGGGGITFMTLWQALAGGEGVSRISVISPALALFAIVFSVFVGVASGYYPANKAVKIPALEAIKSEQ